MKTEAKSSIRWGILSTANIATKVARAIHLAENADLVAVASRTEGRATTWAKEHNVPTAYGTYDALLDDASLDAIYIPLPPSLHAEWTIKAAEHGKHILCEKPLAVTVAQARQMIDAARANGVLLVEAFTHRLNPQLQCARRLVQQGEIGEVKLARAELTFGIRDWATDVRAQKNLGGGALLDAGCYCVSAVRFVLNAEPVAAQAFQHLRYH